MKSLLHLLLLLVVLPASGRASPLQQLDRRAAPRSSSSSLVNSRSSSVGSSSNNNNLRRRPVSPTAQFLRKVRAPAETSQGSPFQSLLLLFLLVVRDAIENNHPRRSIQLAEYPFPMIRISLHAPIQWASRSSRTLFLTFQTLSAGIRETSTSLSFLQSVPTQRQPMTMCEGALTVAMRKGAPDLRRYCPFPTPKGETSRIDVVDRTLTISKQS